MLSTNLMNGVPRNNKFWKQNMFLKEQFQCMILTGAVNY